MNRNHFFRFTQRSFDILRRCYFGVTLIGFAFVSSPNIATAGSYNITPKSPHPKVSGNGHIDYHCDSCLGGTTNQVCQTEDQTCGSGYVVQCFNDFKDCAGAECASKKFSGMKMSQCNLPKATTKVGGHEVKVNNFMGPGKTGAESKTNSGGGSSVSTSTDNSDSDNMPANTRLGTASTSPEGFGMSGTKTSEKPSSADSTFTCSGPYGCTKEQIDAETAKHPGEIARVDGNKITFEKHTETNPNPAVSDPGTDENTEGVTDPSFRVGVGAFGNQPNLGFKAKEFGGQSEEKAREPNSDTHSQVSVSTEPNGEKVYWAEKGGVPYKSNTHDGLMAMLNGSGQGQGAGSVNPGTQNATAPMGLPPGATQQGPNSWKDTSGNTWEKGDDGKAKLVDAKYSGMQDKDWRGTGNSDDDCPVSARLSNGEYGCSGTRTLVDSSKAATAISQIGGQMTTQITGMQSQISAAQAGTQSAALEGAANTAKTSGQIQLATGAMNTAMGIAQAWLGWEQKKEGKKIKDEMASSEFKYVGQEQSGATTPRRPARDDESGPQDYKQGQVYGKNKIANTYIGNFEVNERAGGIQDPSQFSNSENQKQYYLDRLKKVKQEASQVSGTAQMEKKKISNEALVSGLYQGLQGASQITSGTFAMAAADQMKQAAQKLANAERMAAGVAPPKFDGSFGPLNNDQAARGVNGVLGSTTQQAPAEAPPTEDPGAFGAPPRDDGFNPGGDKNLTAGGPPPGAREAPKGGDAGGGGGGGGFSPGAGTQAAPPGHDAEAQARMTDLKGGSSYEMGGNTGGGRGGGARGGGGSDGPDLSSLLAAFMPKKEEGGPAGSGKFDYGGNRGLASQGGGSYLGPGVNIFERISKTYLDKTRRGMIGF